MGKTGNCIMILVLDGKCADPLVYLIIKYCFKRRNLLNINVLRADMRLKLQEDITEY